MNAVVNDLMIHYIRTGKGQPILLLHGWADTLATFNGIVNDLAQNYELILLDLPGFGGSEAPAAAWGLSDYAQLVADFLAKIGCQPFAIIGHSNGGAIAITGLAHGILQTQKLIVISSSGVRSTRQQTMHRQSWLVAAKVGKALTFILPAHLKSVLRSLLYQSSGSDMLVAGHLQETFKQVVSQDILSEAAQLSLPVLCLYGNQDKATPLAYAHLVAEAIPRSKLVVVPDAGHFVHHQQPAEVIKNIKEFLA